MPEQKRDDAGQGKPERGKSEPGKPGAVHPVDAETQKEASEEREKDGGYD